MKEESISSKNLIAKSEELGINPVKCWEVTNDYIKDEIGERSVFSDHQEALDFLRDVLSDPNLGTFETKAVEGIFLSYQDLQKLIDANHKEAKDW